jgi:hypothetical protein
VPRVAGAFAAISIPPHPKIFYDRGPSPPSGAAKLPNAGEHILEGQREFDRLGRYPDIKRIFFLQIPGESWPKEILHRGMLPEETALKEYAVPRVASADP